jgi:hypothetical protein
MNRYFGLKISPCFEASQQQMLQCLFTFNRFLKQKFMTAEWNILLIQIDLVLK